MEYSSPILQQSKGFSFTFGGFMTKVFGLMSFGLFISFFTSFLILAITSINYSFVQVASLLVVPAVILQLVVVFALSFMATRVNALVGSLLFIFYSFLTGLTLGVIMVGYDLLGIITALGATFITFGTMAVFGYVTKRDLSSLGSLAVMGLIGIIIASIFNLLASLLFGVFSQPFYWIITYLGVVIFLVLTAWDVQKLKRLSEENVDVNENRLAVIGALTLYLDFINLFIYMLRILGSRRD